jgi:flavin reductase (DIM6/NTAB) family NADH-FMN oxidoreductase RutF
MEKVLIGKSFMRVSSAVITGVLVKGKPNYITLGACGALSMEPPLVYISVNKSHYTNAGIKENGYFSINIPSKNLVKETDYVGLVSGRDTDKSTVFSAFYGSVNKAPMIEECPVNILCKLVDTINLPRNEVFIGEIIETYASKECLIDDKPDVKKISPLVLAGGSYWELGNHVGKTYTAGKALIRPKST